MLEGIPYTQAAAGEPRPEAYQVATKERRVHPAVELVRFMCHTTMSGESPLHISDHYKREDFVPGGDPAPNPPLSDKWYLG